MSDFKHPADARTPAPGVLVVGFGAPAQPDPRDQALKALLRGVYMLLLEQQRVPSPSMAKAMEDLKEAEARL